MQFAKAPTASLLFMAMAAHQLVSQAASAIAVGGRVLAASGSPVEKVINLLKDLEDRLKSDQSTGQLVFDKYACWCEKATARKAEAIENAKTDLRSLGQQILVEKGKVASLTAEIEKTTKDIKENEQAQAEATAIREKENAAYRAETAEMQQAISALQRALIVLRAATGGSSASLLQHDAAVASASRAVAQLQDALSAAPISTVARLARHGKDPAERLALVRRFARELAGGHSKAGYTPQSATITGILDEMYSTFTTDLERMESDEADNNRQFEDLIATKQKELLELQDKLKKAEQDKTESELMLAEATQAYDDTEAQLKADIEFFDMTKLGCQAKASEWQTRKTLRTEELQGISQALDILSSDEARELFGKAFKPGHATLFLQVDSFERSAAPAGVKKAYQALKQQAARSHSLRLARVAASVRLAKVGHFGDVLKAIDSMIQELANEDKADIAKRDQCLEEYQKINSTTADLKWKIEVNEATISKLEKMIQKLEDEKEETIIAIADVKQQINESTIERQNENTAFLAAKKDDEDAIALITQAKDAIAAYYKNHSIEMGPLGSDNATALLQQGPEFARSADDAPEAEFKDAGHRKGESKGIIAILATIIEDLEGEIVNAQKEEEAAQLRFEEQLRVANKLLAKLEAKEINLGTAITERTGDKTEEETDKTTNEGSLEDEEKYKGDIQPDCDFIIFNFEKRAEARTAEATGLRQAKEFLAGYMERAEEESLVQVPRAGLAKTVAQKAVARHMPLV